MTMHLYCMADNFVDGEFDIADLHVGFGFCYSPCWAGETAVWIAFQLSRPKSRAGDKTLLDECVSFGRGSVDAVRGQITQNTTDDGKSGRDGFRPGPSFGLGSFLLR